VWDTAEFGMAGLAAGVRARHGAAWRGAARRHLFLSLLILRSAFDGLTLRDRVMIMIMTGLRLVLVSGLFWFVLFLFGSFWFGLFWDWMGEGM
jgi:hypothetical protein